jgi:hypothetical protein
VACGLQRRAPGILPPKSGSVYDGGMPYPRPGLLAATCLAMLNACVSDHDVEDYVPASTGLVQPDGKAGGAIAAAEACERLKTARSSAAAKLGCDDPNDSCPSYLLVLGSIACSEFEEGPVAACEAVIDRYERCSDFDTKPCVVTPSAPSCVEAAPPDAAKAPKDAGTSTVDANSGGG